MCVRVCVLVGGGVMRLEQIRKVSSPFEKVRSSVVLIKRNFAVQLSDTNSGE